MNAQASSFPEVQEQTIEGSSAITHMALKADDTKLSFICPSVINFAMKANGEFITPSAGQAYIENLSLMPLRMKSYTVTSDPAAKGMIDTTSATDDNAYEVKVKTQLGNPTPFAVTQNALTSSEWSMTKAGGNTPKLDLTFSDGKMINITNRWGSGAHLQDVVWNVTADVNSQVTVQFDSTGGSAVPDQTFATGGKATTPTTPTREGYEFGGWFTDSACSVAYNWDTPVNQYILLFAKWNVTKEHLKDYTWTEIKTIANDISSKAELVDGSWTSTSDYYNEFKSYAERGDVKELEGASCFRIVSMLHDMKTDDSGKPAAFTFMAAHAMEIGSSWNNTDIIVGNNNSYSDSLIHSKLQSDGELGSKFSEINDLITEVYKPTVRGWTPDDTYDGTVMNLKEKIYLPSYVELGGTSEKADNLPQGEGLKYTYLTNDNYPAAWRDPTWPVTPLFTSLNHKGYLFLQEHKTEYADIWSAFEAIPADGWVSGVKFDECVWERSVDTVTYRAGGLDCCGDPSCDDRASFVLPVAPVFDL